MILGSFASIGFYIFVFSLIEKNNVSITESQVEIKKAEEQKKKIILTKKNILDTKDVRYNLDQRFLGNTEIVRFFDSLETESRLSGVGFSIVSASELKEGEPFKFTLKTIGNYDQNYYYLKILESLPYDLRIKDFSLKYTDQIPQTNAISALQKNTGGWEMNVSLELLLLQK